MLIITGEGWPGGPDGRGEYAEELTPTVYADCAENWIALGADVIGGCCGIFPEVWRLGLELQYLSAHRHLE